MSTESFPLGDFLPIGVTSHSQRVDWDRVFAEAKYAIYTQDENILRQWCRESLSITLETTGRRASMLWDLVRCVADGVFEEFKKAWRALWKGDILEYAVDLCERVWGVLKRLWSAIRDGYDRAKLYVTNFYTMTREEVIADCVSLVGGVLGFILLGGLGDGGLIDMDIAILGLGAHRSIFFHSALIGLAAEVALRSFFNLVQIIHSRLPKKHLPIWDRMLVIAKRFEGGLVSGAWLGVASHLAQDSHIDGWTPYKDLPVALPNWGHHLIMDLNAAGAGFFSWHWHDKVKRHIKRKGAIVPTANGQTLPALQ